MKFFKKQRIYVCALWAVAFSGHAMGGFGEGGQGARPVVHLKSLKKDTTAAKAQHPSPCSMLPGGECSKIDHNGYAQTPGPKYALLFAPEGEDFGLTSPGYIVALDEVSPLKGYVETVAITPEARITEVLYLPLDKVYGELNDKKDTISVAVWAIGNNPMAVHVPEASLFHVYSQILKTPSNTQEVRAKTAACLMNLLRRCFLRKRLSPQENASWVESKILENKPLFYADCLSQEVSQVSRSVLEVLGQKLQKKQDALASENAHYQESADCKALTHFLEILQAVTHETRRLHLSDYDVQVKEDVLPTPSKKAGDWAKEIFPLKADNTPDEAVLSSGDFLKRLMVRAFQGAA